MDIFLIPSIQLVIISVLSLLVNTLGLSGFYLLLANAALGLGASVKNDMGYPFRLTRLLYWGSMLDTLSLPILAIVLVSLVISITLHEAMHAFAGYWLGDDTAQMHGRISLNPLKHIDPLTTILLPMVTLILFRVPLLAAKPVPFAPNRVRFEEFGVALVGFAGPATNALLALAGAGLAHIVQTSLGFGVLDALIIFTRINVALFVFNMIPIPPLDGSRVLYAFAPEPLQDFMAQLENVGIFIIFALVLMVPAFSDLLIYLNQSITTLLF